MREHREVLELVMAVLRAVQRFGLEGSHGCLAPGEEVDHLTLDARGVDDAPQHDQRENGQPPQPRRHVRHLRGDLVRRSCEALPA